MKKLLAAIILTLVLVTQSFALNIVRLGPEYFPDPDRSKAIGSGFIYVGVPDLDPTIEANQKQVTIQQENGDLVEVSQPLRTNAGGVPEFNGSPVTLLVDGDYSLLVQSSSAAQKYYIPATNVGSMEFLSSYGCNIVAAIAEIGDTIVSHLIVDCAPDDLTENLSVPSNIIIEWRAGFPIAGPFTLTFNNAPIAGHYQLFDVSSVTPVFINPAVVSVRWAMEGAPDGTTSNTFEMQTMIDSLPVDRGGTVNVPGTVDNYRCNLTLPSKVLFLKDSTTKFVRLKPAINADPILIEAGADTVINGFQLIGLGGGNSEYGIRADRAVDGASGRNIRKNLFITGFTYGMYTSNNYYNLYENFDISLCTYAIYGTNTFNQNTIQNGKIGSFDYGLYIAGNQCIGNNVKDIAFEGPNAGGVGVYTISSYQNNFTSLYFEGFDYAAQEFPVIETGGVIHGFHKTGGAASGNDAFYIDEFGRDLLKWGVKVGVTVYNRTDGSSATVTAISDGDATNDKLTMTLSGGSENDWDDRDRLVVDAFSLDGSNSYTGNTWSSLTTANQVEMTSICFGINEQSSIIGTFVPRLNGGQKTIKKVDAVTYAGLTRFEIDVSPNLSNFSPRYLNKVKIGYEIINNTASSLRPGSGFSAVKGELGGPDLYSVVAGTGNGVFSETVDLPLDFYDDGGVLKMGLFEWYGNREVTMSIWVISAYTF